MLQEHSLSESNSRDLRRADHSVIQLVGFRLGDEDYAIAITKIQEIILTKPITRIPHAPAFMVVSGVDSLNLLLYSRRV
jgi:chemotaxis signal transduction protein